MQQQFVEGAAAAAVEISCKRSRRGGQGTEGSYVYAHKVNQARRGEEGISEIDECGEGIRRGKRTFVGRGWVER